MYEYDTEQEHKKTSESSKKKKKPNTTGIPDRLKNRFESVSGFSFDDVKVHYNSDKPAQLNAHAFTQGNKVFIGKGQEKHLGHELGHVIQQKLGIVKPTITVNGSPVNNDPKLEQESDRLSGMAIQMKQDVIQRASKNIFCDITVTYSVPSTTKGQPPTIQTESFSDVLIFSYKSHPKGYVDYDAHAAHALLKQGYIPRTATITSLERTNQYSKDA